MTLLACPFCCILQQCEWALIAQQGERERDVCSVASLPLLQQKWKQRKADAGTEKTNPRGLLLEQGSIVELFNKEMQPAIKDEQT